MPSDRFNRFAARKVAVSIDVPYEVLSGDYTGINYSTSKASRGDALMLLRPHHFMMQNRFSMPVFRHWLDMEALTQDYLPGYWAGPGRVSALHVDTRGHAERGPAA